mgnify:CR=1 FL=1
MFRFTAVHPLLYLSKLCFLIPILVSFELFAVENKHAVESPKLQKEKITQDIEHVLNRLKVVQGLSIAVYSTSGTYVAGFGVTDIETQENVTTDTAFYIASSTKSMLALLMSVKHANGKINLDKSLKDFAPNAPFPKAIKAEQISLRDLLSMSSGIKHPAYVHRVAYSGEHDPELLWNLIGKTKPNQSKKIRLGHFRYTNWNYNLLARLVEQKTMQTWQQMLQNEIFNALSMTRTTAYISKAKKESWSIARPHSTLGYDAPKRSYLEKTDKTMHSAGGVYMSAKDALTWLSVFINDGMADGNRLFEPQVIEATREPLTLANTSFGDYQRDHYGLGWYIGPYGNDNVKLVHHFGGFSGARAHVSYMPEKKMGVAVFVNDSQVGSKTIDAIANYVYDTLLGDESATVILVQRIDEIINWKDDLNARIASSREEISRREWTLKRHIGEYKGTYMNEEWGTIQVEIENGLLRVTNGNLTALASAGTKSESIRVELVPMNGTEVQFKSAWFGGIEGLEYEGIKFKLIK